MIRITSGVDETVATPRHAHRAGELSEEERRRLLRIFDAMLPKIPAWSDADTRTRS